MNRTDPSNEDVVAFPDAWREYTLDWRGRGTPRAVEVDAEAPQRLAKLFAEHAELLEEGLSTLEVPAHEAPIRAGIAGAAEPFGAAIAVALLARVVTGQRRLVEDTGRDAWITLHGIGFAAQATVELIGHSVYWDRSRHRQGSRTRIEDVVVPRLASVREYLPLLAPLRSLIAGLPDHEHAQVQAAVEARRSSDSNKFASALLMPDQAAWAMEACDLHNGAYYSYRGAELILAIASTPERLERTGVTAIHGYYGSDQRVALLVDALGADALPVLIGTLEHDEKPDADLRRLLFDTIGRLPSEAALSYLLGDLTNPLATAAAEEAVRRFPVRALRVIAAMAPNADAVTRARLAGFARANGLLDSIDALGDADRERVDALLRRRHPVAEAPPQVFTAPPWTPFAKPASKPAVEGLTPPPVDELRWAPGEREQWRHPHGEDSYWTQPNTWRRCPDNVIDPKHYSFNEFVAYSHEERTAAAFARWDGTSSSLHPSTLQAILARYGEEVAATVQSLIKRKSSFRDALLPFVSLDAARLAATWLSRSRNERALAKTWLDRHPADAAAFLVPDAVGKDAKLRKAATDALRHLDRSVVDQQAAFYGDSAAKAVAAVLDADPLDPQLPRIPKPGKWADPAILPQVLLVGREAALPDEAVRALMTALAMDDPERPYFGVDLLAAECDPSSLAAFSWGLFELWLSAGSPSKDAWAMDQLRRFADDDAVRRLTALIREWPGQSQNRKAIRGLEILGGVGSEAALRAVHTLSQKAKFKALKGTAIEQIEVIAERLDLSLDQLGDRLVPDFGLGAAPLVLDYGPRSFTVKFDESLKPFVIDDKGKRRASAPKPNAKDDPELAQPAYERFAALRKELKTTAAEQVKRLEAAMAAGRTWTLAEFQEYFVGHPLMWHLSSRLVWQADAQSFRLAEDRTLADAEDEPLTLAADSVVRLAHPLSLGGEVKAWASVFADYEILQPFDQLARPVFELSDQERKSGRLARFEGAKTGGGPLIGLLKRGWKFGGPPGRGGYGLYFEFPEGGYLYLDSTPGVHPGYGYDNSAEQTLATVELALPEGGALDRVAISEVLHVIARLTRAA